MFTEVSPLDFKNRAVRYGQLIEVAASCEDTLFRHCRLGVSFLNLWFIRRSLYQRKGSIPTNSGCSRRICRYIVDRNLPPEAWTPIE